MDRLELDREVCVLGLNRLGEALTTFLLHFPLAAQLGFLRLAVCMTSPNTNTKTEPPGPDWLTLPEGSRVLPFLVFMLFTSLPGDLYSGALFWNYAIKTLAAAGLLVWLRPWLPEMKWAVSWEALAVGLGIAVLWLACDQWLPTSSQIWAWFESGMARMPKSKPADQWNPVAHFVDLPALGWGLVAVRVLGRSIIVPMVEEVFYRSFVYRMLIDTNFNKVELSTYKPLAFYGTSILFGLAHGDLWMPGILTGMAYQWLALRKNRLGDSMTAHGVTNLVISIWTIYRGDWRFT